MQLGKSFQLIGYLSNIDKESGFKTYRWQAALIEQVLLHDSTDIIETMLHYQSKKKLERSSQFALWSSVERRPLIPNYISNSGEMFTSSWQEILILFRMDSARRINIMKPMASFEAPDSFF